MNNDYVSRKLEPLNFLKVVITDRKDWEMELPRGSSAIDLTGLRMDPTVEG